MDRQVIVEELKGIIGEYLKKEGFDLIDLIYRYEGRDLYLRVLADKFDGGINLYECASLNRDIGMLLDEKDILQERYVLEVSSPGLDRPLSTKNDFLRCAFRRVRFFLNEPISGKIELEGTIVKVDDDCVHIDIDETTIDIPLSKIIKAKQVIE